MPDSSPNWMYDGDIIMFESKREMNEKWHLRPIKGYMNQGSCSSDSPIHQALFK